VIVIVSFSAPYSFFFFFVFSPEKQASANEDSISRKGKLLT